MIRAVQPPPRIETMRDAVTWATEQVTSAVRDSFADCAERASRVALALTIKPTTRREQLLIGAVSSATIEAVRDASSMMLITVLAINAIENQRLLDQIEQLTVAARDRELESLRLLDRVERLEAATRSR